MRARSAVSFVPGLVFLALIAGAFALDGLATYGRIAGTIMVAVALWGPEIFGACGHQARCSTARFYGPSAAKNMHEKFEVVDPSPWWRRRYSLRSHETVLLGGLGGVVIGCTVPVYLNELHGRWFLGWGVGYGVFGMIAIATMQLMDPGHRLHRAFMASVFHAYRIVLVALFALGAWQAMLGTWRVERAALAPVLASALYALVLFAVGAAWGLGRPGVFAVHWFGVEAHYDLREWDDWSA